MTDELYLIAHKVRGSAAFDIAIQMEMDGEVWWIIPTSGHRAYPYWHVRLDMDDDFPNKIYMSSNKGPGDIRLEYPNMPEDWPDHYPQTSTPKSPNETRASGRSLLQSLGLATDRPHPSLTGKLERRI